MKPQKIIVVSISLLLILIASLIVWDKKQRTADNQASDSCLGTFTEFAYHYPPVDGPDQEVILPLEPWQIAAQLPDPIIQVGQYFDLTTTQTINGNTYVWMGMQQSVNVIKNITYLVYHVDEQSWHEVSSRVDGYAYRVSEIFQTRDGKIWGFTVIEASSALENNQLLFAEFDQTMNAFIIKALVDFPETDVELSEQSMVTGIANEQIFYLLIENTLWIFRSEDGIYTFNAGESELVRIQNLSGYGDLLNVQQTPSGFVFSVLIPGGYRSYQFSRHSNEVTPIDLPNETNNVIDFVDRAGNYWLGDAYAFRGQGEGWKLLHPFPVDYWWRFTIGSDWRYLNPPDPFFESSDGKIWFQSTPNAEGRNLHNGTAWFDPVTGEGCWVTSETGNIAEDGQHRLWVVFRNMLYRFDPEE